MDGSACAEPSPSSKEWSYFRMTMEHLKIGILSHILQCRQLLEHVRTEGE